MGLRPWARGVGAGLAGTTVMTATLWLEKRVRRGTEGFVDYDSSSHVVTAASKILRVDPRTPAQRRAVFLLVHWGYGSAVGVAYRALREELPPAAAATAFYLLCQSMAFVLFPTLGETPPPWRWRRDLLVSSLVQHAVYAAVVAAAGGDAPVSGS